MKQNVTQDRPRPPQERAVKSTMRDIPPAPLSSCAPSPPKTLKRFPEPVAPRRNRKALGIRSWNNNYPILSYAILLYIMYLMLSYAMYDILRQVVFGPNPLATRTRNPKTRSEKLNFWRSELSLNSLKTSQNPSQTPPRPFKMKLKWSPEASQSPFGERSEYKLQKLTPKSDRRDAKSLQTLPKTLPKSSPNHPKIHKKMQSKKTLLLNLIFSWIFNLKIPRCLIWFSTCF